MSEMCDEVDGDVNKKDGRSKQTFLLLGDKILVALIKTPGSYGDGELQLLVPSVAREYMNIGVVHSVSEEAAKVCRAQPRDVVMVKPYAGQVVSDVMVANFGLDEKRHWLIYKSEDVLATVPTDLGGTSKMGFKRIEGNLTAIEVRLIFKIHELYSKTKFPPTIRKLCKLERDYNYATIWRQLYILKDWGYVKTVETEEKHSYWLLTEKGQDLVNGGEVKVSGLGELR